MTPAHTILAVADDIYTLPAFYRKHFAELGIDMLKRKPYSYTVPPVHASSEWIAHNAAMQLKRPLLGKGKRPVIGSMYRPRITTTPAIEIERTRKRKAFWYAADLFACVGVIFTTLVLFGSLL